MRWKDILISILVGAAVAFITTFLEGTLEHFRGMENNAIGSVTASAVYAIKHL